MLQQNTDVLDCKKKSVATNYKRTSNNKTVMRTMYTTKTSRVNVLYSENVIMLAEGSTALKSSGRGRKRAVKIIHHCVLPLAL